MKKSTHTKSWITLSLASGSLGLAIFAVAAPNEKKVDPLAEKITAALPAKAQATPKKERKLLVFSVTAGFRHKSIPTGKKALTLLGDKTGAYTAVVSDDLANFEKDKISQFDAICFLSTTQNVFAPSKKERKSMSAEQIAEAKVKELRLKANLLEFISSGKGFVGIHAASDTFYEWPEYGEMLGGYFDGHPWGSRTDVSIKVEPGKEKHPLVASWNGENQNFKEEIYQLKAPYDSSKYDMLLRLDPEKSNMKVRGIKRKDKDFGVAWIKSYGKGRVFYCSLGHNDHIYFNPKVLDHYLAGIQYAFGDLEIKAK